MRTFIPTGKYKYSPYGTILRYEWKSNSGLRVIYKFNPNKKFKSEYTLPEMLKSGEVEEVFHGNPGEFEGESIHEYPITKNDVCPDFGPSAGTSIQI